MQSVHMPCVLNTLKSTGFKTDSLHLQLSGNSAVLVTEHSKCLISSNVTLPSHTFVCVVNTFK